MSVFNVTYFRKNKFRGTHKFRVFANSATFEQVLFDFVMSDLCESNYQMHYMWFMLNEHILVKRTKANGLVCEYQISLFDMRDRSKLIAEYEVEIDCIENDKTVDVLFQEQDLQSQVIEVPQKKNLPTQWFQEETRAIKDFLTQLNHYGDLKELKKSPYMSKATYHRNLKICIKRGYIKDGKLTKRLSVSKREH